MPWRFAPVFLCAVTTTVAFDGFLDLVRNKPFVSIWNSPSEVCETDYGVHLNLSFFDIDVNANSSFKGDQIVIFYTNQLGLYPYINEQKQLINGGLPQFADLQRHLYKVQQDIADDIPGRGFTGLAIIDWEHWRPIFERNAYNQKQIEYVRLSETVVRLKHPDWSKKKIYEAARIEFNVAAKRLMETTLNFCKYLRPDGFWGFYGFPSCYNYNPDIGECPKETIKYNDQLSWLFRSSSVLAPSLYLLEKFGTHQQKQSHIGGELNETRRVKREYSSKFVPVLPYTSYKYTDTGNFYDLEDLKSSIEQTAFFGFNGVTLWGSSSWYKSRSDCENVRDYIQTKLGPFVKNITEFMGNCSTEHCNSHGRCISKTLIGAQDVASTEVTSLTELLWTLLYAIFRIVFETKKLSPYQGFYCECYEGWSGTFCEKGV